jgi:phosphoribosylanthranilate isomerase
MVDRPRVKICGLTRNEDAQLADTLGADYLGVVLSGGFGRSVRPEAAASVLDGTSAKSVAVVVDETATRTAELARHIGASVIQLHGSEDLQVVRELRGLGDWVLWKAVRAASITDLTRVVAALGASIDGLLVEGWSEGVVGGGGVRLGLDPSEVRAHLPPGVDFVLAGGLTHESVGEAAVRFRPDVVDVSSGLERSLGVKEPELLRLFFDSVRSVPSTSPLHD